MEHSSTSDLPVGYQPYTNCKTRVVDLRTLSLPESAEDEIYRDVYNKAIAQGGDYARSLQSAIESVKYGLAPPVAFPTETVYGLGHSAISTPCVTSIFATKGRPSDNPLIVHASSVAHLERMIQGPLPTVYAPLVKKFWPGPLTILLPVPAMSSFSPKVHPEQDTIAFRIPSNKYARFFIAATDTPLAGPSANSSGKPSPTTAQHVYDDLHGKINFILDGGPCDVGVESTVVDGLHDPPLILRPGGISLSQLRALGGVWTKTAIGYKRHSSANSGTPTPIGTGATTPQEDEDMHVVDINGAPRAPGMKYRHYAPKGRLILFSCEAVAQGRVSEKMKELCALHPSQHTNIGIITRRWGRFAGLAEPTASGATSNGEDPVPGSHTTLGTEVDVATLMTNTGHSIFLHEANLGPDIGRLAHELFYVLRKFDDLGCNYIFAEAVDATEEGADGTVVDAVIDRIEKASSERVW
ncbi:Sua5/YciO/YrdC/YwlC family protein [Cyphellophora europaea CBS 101466]|uniref:Threonylcarbamoyl-AMP synthase n=1 Tax=Cyphellophora europaea (strain CBS 101466) TaxID=1220924 RepID=W2RTD5_CYPE1|nr:Sua5/YciO/YrdC/YwlC family protein [Cyphellophora europaea CBS 101466]ETN39717.1 Sua5/YciO/YrdC/YwlC family protein [Cyphellophora europaea CBS 101466]